MELKVDVYVAGKTINLEGNHSNSPNKGMFISDCYGNICMTRTDEEGFVKSIVDDIKSSVKPKMIKKINAVYINFPNSSKDIPHFADGYFGRPKILYATTRLHCIKGKKKNNLIKIINEIKNMELEKGKKINLIV